MSPVSGAVFPLACYSLAQRSCLWPHDDVKTARAIVERNVRARVAVDGEKNSAGLRRIFVVRAFQLLGPGLRPVREQECREICFMWPLAVLTG